jgi:hypothetical protein
LIAQDFIAKRIRFIACGVVAESSADVGNRNMCINAMQPL